MVKQIAFFIIFSKLYFGEYIKIGDKSFYWQKKSSHDAFLNLNTSKYALSVGANGTLLPIYLTMLRLHPNRFFRILNSNECLLAKIFPFLLDLILFFLSFSPTYKELNLSRVNLFPKFISFFAQLQFTFLLFQYQI